MKYVYDMTFHPKSKSLAQPNSSFISHTLNINYNINLLVQGVSRDLMVRESDS